MKMEWITDRNPDDSYDVIVWVGDRCGVGSYIPILDRWIVQIGTSWSMTEVEAWMPFPPGPKENE